MLALSTQSALLSLRRYMGCGLAQKRMFVSLICSVPAGLKLQAEPRYEDLLCSGLGAV